MKKKTQLLKIIILIISGCIATNDVTSYNDAFGKSTYILADSTGIISVYENGKDITEEYKRERIIVMGKKITLYSAINTELLFKSKYFIWSTFKNCT